MLNIITHGEPDNPPPLLIAHGLFGSGRNWGVIARRLSGERQVLAVDMRNHGASPWHETQSYPDMAGDLAEVIAAHGGVADVLGHSMGGKAAMVLALTHPAQVRKLIVADIAPIGYDHSQNHLIDAMQAVDLSRVESRTDAARQMPTVENDALRAFLLQSLDVKSKRWRFNLEALRREMDKIVGFPRVEGVFEGNTLFLTGSESSYVLPEHRARIKALFPKARFARIPGAGHWLHAQNPRAFEAAVRVFLDQ